MAETVMARLQRRLLDSEKGFTIVEVMVAMAILVIMVASFTQLLGWSVTSIFTDGAKSQALAAAQEKIDQLYYVVISSDTPETDMSFDSERVEIFNDLFDLTNPNARRFYFVPRENTIGGVTVDGYDVTVVVYYQSNKFRVVLESFIGDY